MPILTFTQKRLQALPLRTSPSSKRWSVPSFGQSASNPQPHTITPADSDSEDTTTVGHGQEQASQTQQAHQQPKSHFSPWSSPTVVMSQDPSPFQDAPEMVDRYGDTDMDMDDQPSHSGSDPNHLEPGPSQPDLVIPGSINGRVPTPINCSFAAQVRGNNWGGAAGNLMQGADGYHNGSRHHEAFSSMAGIVADRSVPRSLDHASAMADWGMVQNRRLPSPISESGGEESGSPVMVLDGSPSIRQHPGMPPRAASAMAFTQPLREESPVPGCSHADHAAQDEAMDVEPCTPSPKKGHTRSRHTLNNWTLQPGMKKSFSIGYRADCEKCRQKVPGHFNHIIIS